MDYAKQSQTFKHGAKTVPRICANEHERVLFSGEQCPACAALEELEAARLDISALEIQIYELEGKVQSL